LACSVPPPLPAGTQALDYRPQTLHIQGEPREIRVPAGYRLEVLTEALNGPRLLTFGANGDLFVGSRSGDIYRLAPPYTQPTVLVTLDDYPHSIAFRGEEILIAQTGGLYRAPYQPGQSEVPRRAVQLLAPLPSGGSHSSRTVRVSPDGRVYLSLGISGNCPDEYLHADYAFAQRRGGVLVLREDNGKMIWESFASGLRNPVGFDWQPVTGVLYASNNGPDHLGFEQPPEYFSRLQPGSFHGMPWFQYDGMHIRRDRCIARTAPRPLQDVVAPEVTFPARNAPMAVAFVPQHGMDERLRGDAIVALHGSWATRPSGGFTGPKATRRPPKVVVVRFEGGTAQRVDDLISGFQLPNGDRWARPVGLAIGPDGALYFTSDSGANALFRLTRVPEGSGDERAAAIR
jgi:glucose/arabinose dehydrogenase